MPYLMFLFFFFNDTATTEIYTLSLHDALPISAAQAGVHEPHRQRHQAPRSPPGDGAGLGRGERAPRPVHRERRWSRHTGGDRKSTRLNSSHLVISYAVFCLKKKIDCTP